MAIIRYFILAEEGTNIEQELTLEAYIHSAPQTRCLVARMEITIKTPSHFQLSSPGRIFAGSFEKVKV